VLTHFGGHAMAAGVTISFNHLAEFERQFLSAIEQTITEEALNKERLSDGELLCAETTLALAEQLAVAAPWGQGFPEPHFHGRFDVDNVRLVGQQQNHLRLTLRLSDNRTVVAMAFGQLQPDWLVVGCQVILRYRLNVNEYRAQRQLQFLVEDLFQAQVD
jgi:single-stranded-DNA-specific exonuclease